MDSCRDENDGFPSVGFLLVSFEGFILNGEHMQVFSGFSFLDDLISKRDGIRYHIFEIIDIVFHFPVSEGDTHGNVNGLIVFEMVINHEVDLVSVLNKKGVTMR